MEIGLHSAASQPATDWKVSATTMEGPQYLLEDRTIGKVVPLLNGFADSTEQVRYR